MESVGSYKGADNVDLCGLEATELRLGLPGTPPTTTLKAKRALEEQDDDPTVDNQQQQASSESSTHRSLAPPAKSQVVGWPPVQSFRRKNNAQGQQQASKNKSADQEKKHAQASSAAVALANPALMVKVSMDGAPYLRKVDLGIYKGYKDLRLAVDAMFGCFSTQTSPQYIVTYEDKDGDWMLVGDVPWEMFASSCKRLRIMKSSTDI